MPPRFVPYNIWGPGGNFPFLRYPSAVSLYPSAMFRDSWGNKVLPLAPGLLCIVVRVSGKWVKDISSGSVSSSSCCPLTRPWSTPQLFEGQPRPLVPRASPLIYSPLNAPVPKPPATCPFLRVSWTKALWTELLRDTHATLTPSWHQSLVLPRS